MCHLFKWVLIFFDMFCSSINPNLTRPLFSSVKGEWFEKRGILQMPPKVVDTFLGEIPETQGCSFRKCQTKNEGCPYFPLKSCHSGLNATRIVCLFLRVLWVDHLPFVIILGQSDWLFLFYSSSRTASWFKKSGFVVTSVTLAESKKYLYVF